MSGVTSTASGGWTFRDGRAGRLGVGFAAVWLVFLGYAARDAWRAIVADPGSAAAWLGVATTVGFVVSYLAAFVWVRRRRHRMLTDVAPRDAGMVLAGLTGLGLVMCVTVGESGSVAAVYLAVVGVLLLPTRLAVVFTVLLAVAVELSGRLVPGWSDQSGQTFAVCSAAFAMWGIQQMMLRNVDLLRAREENARLAVAEERNRFGRDLHDILGHSLTVITVKAELANRLLESDPDRARHELEDLERLSRDALADVRRAVAGYREISLSGELARAREALASAGIRAELPNSVDAVPSDLREVFAWAVREGVTNVIRHSGATRCQVRLDQDRVVICDDGTGPDPGLSGHGLTGLTERATAAGAVLVTTRLQPRGFRLEVTAR